MFKMSVSVKVSGMLMAHRFLMLLMSEPCDDFIFIFQLFPEMRHLLHQFLHLMHTNTKQILNAYTNKMKLYCLHINNTCVRNGKRGHRAADVNL